MSQIVFLNERSHPCGASLHPAVCAEIVARFLAVMRAAKGPMPRLSLVTAEPLPDIRLSDGHSIREWINAPNTNKELARFLLSLGQMAPFRAARDAFGDPDPGVTEYTHDGEPFPGMPLVGVGLAHLYDGLAVSFGHDEGWLRPQLPLAIRTYTEDGEVAAQGSVLHAAVPEHVQLHRETLVARCRRAITGAADLWRRREELLGNLRLLPGTESQLATLGREEFQQVRKWLFTMEDAVAAWDPATHPTPAYPTHCTDESRSRRDLCWFEDTDGQRHLFSWHGRFTPSPGRIHFRLDAGRRKVVVAYIGRKLGA